MKVKVGYHVFMNPIRFQISIITVFQVLIFFVLTGCGNGKQSSGGGDSTSTLILPGERVGQIKAGMTLSEVEKVMGTSQDPAFGSGKQRRVYPKLGLTLKLASDGSQQVESVQCGALDPFDPLVRSNKYKTSENIGMGSTREQLIGVYGQPSQIKNDWTSNTPEEGLYYDSLGMRFYISNNKIHQIIIFLK